jgi:biotin-dependent carboxylase-like uncharacterized protein
MIGHLSILCVGAGATIQDGGRFHYRRFGVTPAGPMDWAAFTTANLALGNAADAAAIEIGIGGIEISCDMPVMLAFAGGSFVWTRDGVALPSAMRLTLTPGQKLAARAGAWGSFAYLAVTGAIATPLVLGSRATHTRAHLGGIDGRMLQAGDRLPIAGEPGASKDDAAIAAPWLEGQTQAFRVVLGPQQDYFDAAALEAFFDSAFRLTHQADRMAYKLEGPKVAHNRDFNIVSDGIALGAIQIAGDGQPLVLMADHQPTGGYPKLGYVIRADIGRLAQLRPGETCRFTRINVETARAALLDLDTKMAQIANHLRQIRRVPTSEDLLRINLISGVVDRSAR